MFVLSVQCVQHVCARCWIRLWILCVLMSFLMLFVSRICCFCSYNSVFVFLPHYSRVGLELYLTRPQACVMINAAVIALLIQIITVVIVLSIEMNIDHQSCCCCLVIRTISVAVVLCIVVIRCCCLFRTAAVVASISLLRTSVVL